MKRKTKSGFSAFISSVIMILIMFLTLSFVYQRTNEFTTGFRSFYVKYGNTLFVSESNNYMTMETGKTYKFKVKSTIDTLADNVRNYNVNVIVNPDVDYKLVLCKSDGTCNRESLNSVNFNLYFIFTYGDDYFTITDSGYMYNYILSNFDEYSYIDLNQSSIDENSKYLRLVITSLKDADTINIDFNLIGNEQ